MFVDGWNGSAGGYLEGFEEVDVVTDRRDGGPRKRREFHLGRSGQYFCWRHAPGVGQFCVERHQ